MAITSPLLIVAAQVAILLVQILPVNRHPSDDRPVETEFCVSWHQLQDSAWQMASAIRQSRDACAARAGNVDFAFFKV